VSKRKKKQPDIDILDQHMGKTYKLWSERSDRDFERWLNMQSYFSPLYRVAYFVSGIILILIGVIQQGWDCFHFYRHRDHYAYCARKHD